MVVAFNMKTVNKSYIIKKKLCDMETLNNHQKQTAEKF